MIEQASRYFEIRLAGQRFNGRANTSLRCPLHDDRHASLSVNRDEGVWKCHGGCGGGGILDFEQKFSHCDRDTARQNVNELLGTTVFGGKGKKPVAIYDYDDQRGKLIFQKLRYHPKTFAVRRKDDKGKWIWNLDGITNKPLYHLPDLITYHDAVIVEGEKDADNLKAALKNADLKAAVVTNFEGAGPGKWCDHYSPYFAGRDVVIIPDNDDSGRARAEEIASKIHPYASGIKVIALPGLPEKGDVSDYLESHTIQDLLDETRRQKKSWKPTAVAVTSPLESQPIEEERAAIVRADMPETVLDGRVGEFCQSRLGRFPIAYSFPALVTAAGALIPRADRQIRTNLYTCLVGPKASGKTQSIENVFRCVGMWPQHSLLLKAKFGSAEGLIDRLQDTGSDAVRLVYPDELGHLLAKATIDGASFPYILNTAYNEDRQEGGTKGKAFNLDCRLSLLGGLVEELFGDSFGMATTGGLYDRFIFGLCPEPYQHFYQPPEDTAKCLSPVPADVNREVWEVCSQWVKNGINPRVAEHALRVAYICASVDGRPTLRSADLGPALAFAEYQMKVRVVLAPNPGQNPDAICANKIRNWLTQYSPNREWIKRRDVDRGIHSSRLGPGVFNRCLQNLQLNDEIELDLKLGRLRSL